MVYFSIYLCHFFFLSSVIYSLLYIGLLCGSAGKESTCNVGDLGSIPGLGRSPGGRNGSPLQYSCLENPMDGGALWATVHGVMKRQTQLSDFTFHFHARKWQERKGREGNGNPLQCSFLENPRNGGAWWAAIYGVVQSQT